MSAPDTALVVFAHGSSVEPANEAVREVGRALASAGNYRVQAAFLGGGEPDLRGAVSLLSNDGIQRIIIIPYFLTLGLHLQRDLPKLIQEAGSEHPAVRLEMTPPLDGHPALVNILLDRAAGAVHGEHIDSKVS